MATTRKTKVAICVYLKIKDLAQQIYCLDTDEIICFFTELDDLFSKAHTVDRNKWNDSFEQWIKKQSEKLNIDEKKKREQRAWKLHRQHGGTGVPYVEED